MTNSSGDKMKGKANEAIGKGKQGLGEATDNERMKQEGKGQEYRGEGQQAKGEVKDKIKGAVDKF